MQPEISNHNRLKKQRIFLTGMMGAGKTTIGAKLAAELDIPFLDLDILIEEQEQLAVADIFSQKGESYFREVERQVLQTVIEQETEFVMATGGGTACFFQNAALLNQHGICLWLDPPLAEILKRLQKENVQIRPVLQNKTGKELNGYLQQLRQSRLPFYQQAHLHITAANPSVSALVYQILDFLKSKL